MNIEKKKTNEWRLPNLIEEVRRIDGQIRKKQGEGDSSGYINRSDESFLFDMIRRKKRKSVPY